MFEFIKNLFKKEVKEYPGVDRVQVSRAKVDRIEVKKFEPKRFEPREFEPKRLCKVRYNDTDEVVEKPFDEAMDDIFNNERPVTVIGYVQ